MNTAKCRDDRAVRKEEGEGTLPADMTREWGEKCPMGTQGSDATKNKGFLFGFTIL